MINVLVLQSLHHGGILCSVMAV